MTHQNLSLWNVLETVLSHLKICTSVHTIIQLLCKLSKLIHSLVSKVFLLYLSLYLTSLGNNPFSEQLEVTDACQKQNKSIGNHYKF